MYGVTFDFILPFDAAPFDGGDDDDEDDEGELGRRRRVLRLSSSPFTSFSFDFVDLGRRFAEGLTTSSSDCSEGESSSDSDEDERGGCGRRRESLASRW